MGIILAIIVIGSLTFGYRYWITKTTKSGAPFVALDMRIVERMLEMAKVKETDVVYDLGSGDGRIPIFASLRYKVRSVGVELDQLRYLYSNFLVFINRLGNKVNFQKRNIFDVNLSDANVVTMFLLQETNEKLMKKMESELRPGTRVVSAAFNFPGWRPLKVDYEYATPYGPLYLYQIGVSDKK